MGEVFLPMHLPVLLAGFCLGPLFGGAVGILTPLASCLVTGMAMPAPAILPFMVVELAVYGAAAGLLGIVCAFFVSTGILAASETYGVPFLSPISPKNGDSAWESILIRPIWKRERRPRNLRTQDPALQPHISRKWTLGDDKEDQS